MSQLSFKALCIFGPSYPSILCTYAILLDISYRFLIDILDQDEISFFLFSFWKFFFFKSCIDGVRDFVSIVERILYVFNLIYLMWCMWWLILIIRLIWNWLEGRSLWEAFLVRLLEVKKPILNPSGTFQCWPRGREMEDELVLTPFTLTGKFIHPGAAAFLPR